MKKLKNEDIKDLKEYNNILFKQGNKTSKNNPNKNLLLFKKEDISKNNLYLNNPKNFIDIDPTVVSFITLKNGNMIVIDESTPAKSNKEKKKI